MFTARTAQKQARIAQKRNGTAVTLRWNEWPTEEEPEVDPTSGRVLDPNIIEAQKSCATKAFLHFISPTTAVQRMFGEIQPGDCLAEFLLPLARVLDPGDTDFAPNQVVMQYDITAANRALEYNATPASFMAVALKDLKDAELVIDGERWVQQKISADLAATWDAIFAGITMAQSVLLRKAT